MRASNSGNETQRPWHGATLGRFEGRNNRSPERCVETGIASGEGTTSRYYCFPQLLLWRYHAIPIMYITTYMSSSPLCAREGGRVHQIGRQLLAGERPLPVWPLSQAPVRPKLGPPTAYQGLSMRVARQKGLAGLEIVNVGEGALIRRLNPERQQAQTLPGSRGLASDDRLEDMPPNSPACSENGACIPPWLCRYACA